MNFFKSKDEFRHYVEKSLTEYLTGLRVYRRINLIRRQQILKQKVKDILNTSSVACAYDSEVNDLFYSFVLYTKHGKKLCVHFCYTKPDFRNKGILKKMLSDLESGMTRLVYTAHTSKPLGYSLFRSYRMETMQ